MRPSKVHIFSPGNTDPDPITSPGNVTRDMCLGISSNSGSLVYRFHEAVLFLAAPPSETVTFDIYAVDAGTLSNVTFEPMSSTVFYPVAKSVSINGGDSPKYIRDLVGLNGLFYIRQVSDTLTTVRSLSIIVAGGRHIKEDPFDAVLTMDPSPTFLYVPRRDVVTLDGSGNVEQFADLIDVEDQTRALIQSTPSNRPLWLENSSAPNQVPGIKGNGLTQHLQGASGSANLVANLHTVFALLVRPVSSGTESAAGIGSSTAGNWHSFGCAGTSGLSRRSGLGNITAGTFAGGDTFWVESDRNASSVNIRTSDGGSNSAAAGATLSSNILVVCANRNSGGLIEPFDGELLAYIAWNSILPSGNREAVRDVLNAYAGI